MAAAGDHDDEEIYGHQEVPDQIRVQTLTNWFGSRGRAAAGRRTLREVGALVSTTSPAFRRSAVLTNPTLALLAFARGGDREGIQYIRENYPALQIPWAELSSAAYNGRHVELARELDEHRILLADAEQRELLNAMDFYFQYPEDADSDDELLWEDLEEPGNAIVNDFAGGNRRMTITFLEVMWNMGYDINTRDVFAGVREFSLLTSILRRKNDPMCIVWLIKHGAALLGDDNYIKQLIYSAAFDLRTEFNQVTLQRLREAVRNLIELGVVNELTAEQTAEFFEFNFQRWQQFFQFLRRTGIAM
jgi:hypothetical protein